MNETQTDTALWYCPMWACPFSARETEQIVLHLEAHCKPNEVIRRELERFEKAAFNGGIACGKAQDDPENPKKR